MSKKVAVIGAGSWGTALTIGLVQNGHDVTLWTRRPEVAAFIKKERSNPTYLPEAVIPESVVVTSNLEEAVQNRETWVFAVPSQAIRSVAGPIVSLADEELIVVSVAKGIEKKTLLTTTQVLREVLTPVPAAHIGVLYGPSHAEEVAEGIPTTVVAAAYSSDVAHRIQDCFNSSRFRVYLNYDLIGVEIAGSVKNIMAIAAGIGDGLGYGDNTKAAIITRGLAEIKRLGLAMGAASTTFEGLAGIGDLVVTSMSRFSRNRYLGEQIGKGRSLEAVQREMTMIAEGVSTTESVYALSQRYHIEMPITEAVYSILFENKKPQVAVDELMTRTTKREDWLPDFLQD